MAVTVASCCFSVFTSTVKSRYSIASQNRFATSHRSIGSISSKSANHNRTCSNPKRGSNREVNPNSFSLSLSLPIHTYINTHIHVSGSIFFDTIEVDLFSVYRIVLLRKLSYATDICDCRCGSHVHVQNMGKNSFFFYKTYSNYYLNYIDRSSKK
jgi:hypothetical protein